MRTQTKFDLGETFYQATLYADSCQIFKRRCTGIVINEYGVSYRIYGSDTYVNENFCAVTVEEAKRLLRTMINAKACEMVLKLQELQVQE